MTVRQAPLRERAIRYVKGVGPRRMNDLARLGIHTIEDACYYAPRRYEDRTRPVAICDVLPDRLVTVRGHIRTKSLRRLRGGRTIVEAAVDDGSGLLSLAWFNQPYLAQQLTVGEEVVLYGRAEPGRRLQFIHPEMERVESDEGESIHMGRIVPVYPLVGGISQRWLRQVIAMVLELHSDELEDSLPERLRSSKGWPVLPDAVRQLHFPSSWEALASAQARLAFEELFILQVKLAQRRARLAARVKPQRYRRDGPLTRGLRDRLPFPLTASQQEVLDELLNDLDGPAPMQRLLQGDVGCGKTIIIMLLIAVAVQSGYQAALMAPTELLAEQHARLARQLLGPLGVAVEVLAQGVGVANRKRLVEGVARGTITVVIGTHALLQSDVVFHRLALVVIDEQHKFGVVQRAHLASKARAPDVVVVTATPIPRTLALSSYGDLSISTVTELPPGRRPIRTLWLNEAQREELYAMIRRQLAQGRQGYVVYPLVEEASAHGLRAATHMARHLQQDVFPEVRVGLLHGQMRSKEKEGAMLAFARGEVRLLVSTLIVEVGLDIPNATMMVIEHPERFGLAQLHQLRGRIGRGEHAATCVMVGDARDEAVRQRLIAFSEVTDGFALAERDLEQRGPGQLLGRQQHGWLRFRIANLVRDRLLLESARQEAAALIERDPQLRDPSVSELRARLAGATQT